MGEHIELKFINVVASSRLNLNLDLKKLCYEIHAVEYNSSMNNVIWRHKSIQSTALLTKNGYISVHGARSIFSAKKSIRQYARLLSKKGYSPSLRKIKIMTMSAVHKMNLDKVDLSKLREFESVSYEPEIFSAAIMSKHDMKFLIYTSGAIVVSGIKNMKSYMELAKTALIQISLMLTL